MWEEERGTQRIKVHYMIPRGTTGGHVRTRLTDAFLLLLLMIALSLHARCAAAQKQLLVQFEV